MQTHGNSTNGGSISFGNISFSSENELIEAAKKFPYSLPLQAMLAAYLKGDHKLDFHAKLRQGAILSPDRAWLYNFLHEPKGQKQEVKKVESITVEPVKETRISQVIEIQPVLLDQKSLTFVAETEIIENKPVKEVETFSLTEVFVPEHTEPVTTEDPHLITTALANSKHFILDEPKKETISPETKTKLDNVLEREIIKEAIDKTIQREASVFEPRQDSITGSEEMQKNPGDFSFWLNPAKSQVASREERLKKIDALIEKFIKSEPKIVAKKTEFYSPVNVAKQSVSFDENLVSEPLAAIFEKQGYFDKAIKAYEKLSLKFPEKRAYFAGRIEKIQEIIKNIKNAK